MKVLVVEDESRIRLTTISTLQRVGHETVEAEDGAQALRFLEGGLTVDALITDIRMPGADGWTVARAYRERFPNLPVLYVTGYADDRQPVPGGVVIQKPYRMSQVLPILHSLADAQLSIGAGVA